MKVTKTDVDGILILEPSVFEDQRGIFMESWHQEKYAEVGIHAPFVQDNVSVSRKGVLRGMHFQNPGEQGKLVTVLRGSVFDVAVDLRTDSPTFKKWVGIELSESNHRQLWIPAGLAHGFTVLSADALFLYKCTEYYRPDYEHAVHWNDPEVAIDWPGKAHIVSVKDSAAPFLRDISPAALPKLGR